MFRKPPMRWGPASSQILKNFRRYYIISARGITQKSHMAQGTSTETLKWHRLWWYSFNMTGYERKETALDYYLIRHGESTLNIQHVLQGWKNPPLSGNGVRQAKTLHGVLPLSYPIISSDLTRAMDTARMFRYPSQPIQPDARLREIDVGKWQGRAKASVQNLPEWREYQIAPATFQFPGGESLPAVQRRIAAAFEEYMGNYSSLILVSHQIALKTLICHIQGWSLDRVNTLDLPNASVTHIVRQKSQTLFCDYIGRTNYD
jgi:broad specificity phosphatase PhoE